jgi:DNA-binding NtrC family response regulator
MITGSTSRTDDIVPVLIASANDALRQSLVQTFQGNQCFAEEALGGADALAKLEAGECRFLLLDRLLPDLDSEELSAMVKSRYPGVHVVMLDSHSGRPLTEMSGNAEAARIVALLRAGSVSPASAARTGAIPSLITSNIPPKMPAASVRSSAADSRLQAHPLATFGTSPQSDNAEPLPGLVGNSAAMRRMYRLARKVAPRKTPVLILGGTGTGKELVSRAIHQLSPRASRPMVVINCAAIPETLLESELFGYARGAFTGAAQSRVGRIHAAHGGTLFLDEIGDMPLNLQAKLLRVVESGEVQRLGTAEVFRVDVRIVAATNADLERKLEENTFRRDLFYRLSVFPIELPPLMRRTEDILPLAEFFLAQAAPHAAKLSPAAVDALRQHSWPGNVRELRHVIERASILAEETGLIYPEHIVFSCTRQVG